MLFKNLGKVSLSLFVFNLYSTILFFASTAFAFWKNWLAYNIKYEKYSAEFIISKLYNKCGTFLSDGVCSVHGQIRCNSRIYIVLFVFVVVFNNVIALDVPTIPITLILKFSNSLILSYWLIVLILTFWKKHIVVVFF